MDDNINPNVPGSNPVVGSDQGQAQMPGAGVPVNPPAGGPEPAQPAVEQPQVPSSEPTVPQPSVDVPGQTTPEPQVGA